MIKKHICIILAILLIFAHISVAAENEIIVSDNSCIRVLDNQISVFSHPFNSTYFISSQKLLQALSSPLGYTLSYVDNEKEESMASRVKDGYIRAQKDSEVLYYQIIANTGSVYSESFTRRSTAGYYLRNDSAFVTTSFEKGVGGRSDDDYSFVFHADEATDLRTQNVYLQKGTPFTADGVYTTEFSVYNASDATAAFVLHSANGFAYSFSFGGDGNAYVEHFSSGNIQKNIGMLQKGVWHEVAVVTDHPRSRILVYVDGEFCGDSYHTQSNNPQIDYMQFKMRSDSNDASSGIIAYDDISVYGGYYNYEANLNVKLLSDELFIDNSPVCEIYGAVGMSSAQALSKISAEQGFTFDMTEDFVADGSVLSVYNSQGNLRYSYTFKDGDYISPVNIKTNMSGNNERVSAQITICPKSQADTWRPTLFIASFCNDRLLSISSAAALTDSKQQLSAAVEVDREQSTGIKVYMWNEDLKPLKTYDPINTRVYMTTAFEDETQVMQLVGNSICLHSRSGVLTVNNKKYLLENKPYYSGDALMVPAAEISSRLGISYSGEQYAQVNTFFEESLGFTVCKMDAPLNSGAYIMGSTMFEPPQGEMLQKLNDYLFYFRPSEQAIAKAYEASENYAQHPRIQASMADFDRIKSEMQTNSLKQSWGNTAVRAADYLATKSVLTYEITGGRLLGVSRAMLERMYVFGMAYRLTGEQKYVDRAWLELKAVSDFPDWHPSHTLDLGEMCAAVAIGYDWMYDGLTDTQRSIIEQGIYKHAFAFANDLYEGRENYRTPLVLGDSNWNVVCNGGIAMAGLAMLDVFPQSARRIVSNAVRAYDIMAFRFAPQGAWYEGPGYWEYVMQYTAKLMSSLKSVLGTYFALETCEGFDTSSEFIINLQSDTGIYCYGDGMRQKQNVPEIFWQSDVFGNEGMTSSLLTLSGGNMANYEDIILALLWYDTGVSASNVSMPLDAFYESEDVASMRDKWGEGQTFVGIHAGTTNVSHSHLDTGTFVFDSMGVRWALDMGQANYNLPGYWDETPNGVRWNIFQLRAEAHNALVINPGLGPDQKYVSYAPITKFTTNDGGGIAAVDMTSPLSDNVTSAKRGFYFTDNRSSLVIRDELTLKDTSEVYWFMITEADVDISGNTAILTQDGKKMKLEFLSDVPAQLSCTPAQPLPTSPPGDGINANRISINASASGSMTVTVKLTPYGKEGSNIEDYNTAIDSWTLQ